MSFPEKIRVTGLPFMLQGWNNVYHLTAEISDGCPVYRLNPYTLYLFIDIIGVRILRIDGVWCMQRDCDDHPMYSIKKYGDKNQPDPFGYWSSGMHVKPH